MVIGPLLYNLYVSIGCSGAIGAKPILYPSNTDAMPHNNWGGWLDWLVSIILLWINKLICF